MAIIWAFGVGVMFEESECQGYLWLQSELEVSLGYMRPYLIKGEWAGEMVQVDTVVCVCNPSTPVVRWENHLETWDQPAFTW